MRSSTLQLLVTLAAAAAAAAFFVSRGLPPQQDISSSVWLADASQVARGLDWGVSSETPNIINEPLLHGVGSSEVVEILIGHGADVNARDSRKQTPLFSAASAPVAKALIDCGADLRAKDCNGRTPLHEAAAMLRTDVVEILLDNGLDVNARSGVGDTPLHCAAPGLPYFRNSNGRHTYGMQLPPLPLIELLLSRGADASLKNDSGQTPIDIARENGFDDVVRCLAEHEKRK